MSKKIDVTLIPRYEGTRAIEYEKIGSTIRKTRLYKFIRVAYSQPLISFYGWSSYVISFGLREYLDFVPYIIERVPKYLG